MKKKLLYFFFAVVAGLAQLASAQTAAPNVGDGTALDRFAAKPTPRGCPVGRHWTLLGSNIAHCVDDDPDCGSKDLVHDTLGNPSCVAPVVTHQTSTVACPAGKVGSGTSESRTVTTHHDGTVQYGSWVLGGSDCAAPPPPPTCSNGASDYPTCTPPAPPAPPPSCSNGASDYPTCTPPSSGSSNPATSCAASQVWSGSACVNRCSGSDTWNGASCVPAQASCPTHTASSSEACPLGQTGSLSFTNTVDCNGNVLSTTQNGGSCQVVATPPKATSCTLHFPQQGVSPAWSEVVGIGGVGYQCMANSENAVMRETCNSDGSVSTDVYDDSSMCFDANSG